MKHQIISLIYSSTQQNCFLPYSIIILMLTHNLNIRPSAYVLREVQDLVHLTRGSIFPFDIFVLSQSFFYALLTKCFKHIEASEVR